MSLNGLPNLSLLSSRKQASPRWSRLPGIFLFLGDIVAMTSSFYFARVSHALYYHLKVVTVLLHWWGSALSANLLVFPMMMCITIAWFMHKGHYSRSKPFWDELGEVFLVFTFLSLLNAAFAFSGRLPLSRLWLFSTWILAFVLIPLVRFLIHYFLSKSKVWQIPYVLLGGGGNAIEASRAIASEPALGLQLSAVILPEDTIIDSRFDNTLPRIPLGNDLLATLTELGNPYLVIALEADQYQTLNQLLQSLSINYPKFTIAPPLRGLTLLGLEAVYFFNHEILMLQSRDNLLKLGPRIMKRSFDMVCALLLLIMLSPFLILIAWLIHHQDKGPAIFSHKRIGKYGKEFGCLKFRTMVTDADKRLTDYFLLHPDAKEEYEKNFKLKNDPRVTPIGKFLRRTSLDELPQLFNVLKGEMSLVGPRPVTLFEIQEYYGKTAEAYTKVLPGVTGLWQTSGRSDTTYDQRLYYDSWYVKNWSLWYDIVILLRTVKVLFGKGGAY